MIKISIVTPVLNGGKTLQTTINSIRDQNFKNFEHIIVDGISNDNTHKIIKKNEKHFSKIIIEKDKNIYDAMNKGIKVANGDLIGILNADDYYNNEAFSHVSKTRKL